MGPFRRSVRRTSDNDPYWSSGPGSESWYGNCGSWYGYTWASTGEGPAGCEMMSWDAACDTMAACIEACCRVGDTGPGIAVEIPSVYKTSTSTGVMHKTQHAPSPTPTASSGRGESDIDPTSTSVKHHRRAALPHHGPGIQIPAADYTPPPKPTPRPKYLPTLPPQGYA